MEFQTKRARWLGKARPKKAHGPRLSLSCFSSVSLSDPLLGVDPCSSLRRVQSASLSPTHKLPTVDDGSCLRRLRENLFFLRRGGAVSQPSIDGFAIYTDAQTGSPTTQYSLFPNLCNRTYIHCSLISPRGFPFRPFQLLVGLTRYHAQPCRL